MCYEEIGRLRVATLQGRWITDRWPTSFSVTLDLFNWWKQRKCGHCSLSSFLLLLKPFIRCFTWEFYNACGNQCERNAPICEKEGAVVPSWQCPRTYCLVSAFIFQQNWHNTVSTPYSTDLTPCDFFFCLPIWKKSRKKNGMLAILKFVASHCEEPLNAVLIEASAAGV